MPKLEWTADEMARFNLADDDAVKQLLAWVFSDPDNALAGLSTSKKEFVVVTAAATIIERCVCEAAEYRVDDALGGLDALVVSMRRQILKRCGSVAQ
jgi:hypothetical protein